MKTNLIFTFQLQDDADLNLRQLEPASSTEPPNASSDTNPPESQCKLS